VLAQRAPDEQFGVGRLEFSIEIGLTRDQPARKILCQLLLLARPVIRLKSRLMMQTKS
jgi:hypothetical protein